MEERPWGDWSHGKPMTAHALARQLKPFNVKPCHRRDGLNTVRGYKSSDLEDAWGRYLP
jgi:hypothetical protein